MQNTHSHTQLDTLPPPPARKCPLGKFRSSILHGAHGRTGQHPFGGQTQFCPNGERKLFVTRPRQGEKNNKELLQSLFFDGR